MGLTQSSPIEKTDVNEKNVIVDLNTNVMEQDIDNDTIVLSESVNNVNIKDNITNAIDDKNLKEDTNATDATDATDSTDAINIKEDIDITDTTNNDEKFIFNLKESVDAFVKKLINDAAIEVCKQNSNINPKYSEWLSYLRKWTVLDTKSNKDIILKTIDNDIQNNITNNAETFGLITINIIMIIVP